MLTIYFSQHWTAIQEFLRHFWSSYPVTSAVLYNMVCHQQLKYIVFVVTVSLECSSFKSLCTVVMLVVLVG